MEREERVSFKSMSLPEAAVSFPQVKQHSQIALCSPVLLLSPVLLSGRDRKSYSTIFWCKQERGKFIIASILCFGKFMIGYVYNPVLWLVTLENWFFFFKDFRPYHTFEKYNCPNQAKCQYLLHGKSVHKTGFVILEFPSSASLGSCNDVGTVCFQLKYWFSCHFLSLEYSPCTSEGWRSKTRTGMRFLLSQT